jgi:hypothetical protein
VSEKQRKPKVRISFRDYIGAKHIFGVCRLKMREIEDAEHWLRQFLHVEEDESGYCWDAIMDTNTRSIESLMKVLGVTAEKPHRRTRAK